MDLYISSLLLGAAGLGAMALGGLGIRGGHGHSAGQGHGAHSHGGSHVHGVHAHNASAHSVQARSASAPGITPPLVWLLSSPRLLFSLLLGFGAVGELVRPLAGGAVQIAVAALGAVLFERFLVTPLWNFSMRFASAPAQTLESAVTDEATAVTAFDAQGHGIVSVEVDGQIVQVLATLRPADRELGGRIRAGQRVRIEDVNADQNRCTVSLL